MFVVYNRSYLNGITNRCMKVITTTTKIEKARKRPVRRELIDFTSLSQARSHITIMVGCTVTFSKAIKRRGKGANLSRLPILALKFYPTVKLALEMPSGILASSYENTISRQKVLKPYNVCREKIFDR